MATLNPGRGTVNETSYRKVQTALIAALVILAFAGQLLPARAAETLTTAPARAQEENSPGVTLTLTVTAATVGLSYVYTWSVVDPSGNNKTTFSTTAAASSAFTVSKVYPTDFGGGAAVRYVGQYTVAILRTSPSFGLAATGHFNIGLTDKVFYQRTEAVSIKATSYSAMDVVTVSVTRGGILAPGFPKPVSADASGNVAFTWLTTPITVTGNYTVSLSGTTTAPKNPADSQWFVINRASLGVLQVSMVSSSLQKSQTAQFTFTATYPNSSAVQSGSATLTITDPDGKLYPATASYDSTTLMFLAGYQVPLNSKSGTWRGTLAANSLDDGFGNTGPTSPLFRDFNVQPAILTLIVSVPNGTRTSGDILAISATVTAPGGTSFSQGNVTAQFSAGGRFVGRLITLLYDQGKGKWVGSYIIASSDPSGVWVLQVTASDSFGNSGQGSTSMLVSAVQSPLTSFWFLSVLGAIGAAVLILFLFLKRKRILRRQLQVDLTAVGLEARRVMDQDFFKSIQEQLGRKKEDSGESPNG